MNLALDLDQYYDQYVYFCEPTRNNIMNEGSFIRSLYSTNIVHLNGIYLRVTVNDFVCDKYYDKYRCIFNVGNHMGLIQQLRQFEENLLVKVGIQNKIPQHKIYEQLLNGNIKIFNNVTIFIVNIFPSRNFIVSKERMLSIFELSSVLKLSYIFKVL